MGELKVYVFCPKTDYAGGAVVVLAPSLVEAKRMVEAEWHSSLVELYREPDTLDKPGVYDYTYNE